MRIRVVAVLLSLIAATGAAAQSPTPPTQPSLRTTPARLGQSDVEQFRSLRGATSAGEPMRMPPPGPLSAYGAQQTSFQSPPSPQDDSKIPAILSGNPQASGKSQSAASTALPTSASLNRSTLPPATSSTGTGSPLPSATPLLPRAIPESPIPGTASPTQTPNTTQEKPMDASKSTTIHANLPPAANVASGINPLSAIQIPTEVKPGRVDPAVAQEPETTAKNSNKAPANLANATVRPQDEAPDVSSPSSPMLTAPGASIHVNTVGPKSISVGKNATYEITVTNHGSNPAHQLAVTFATPNWIEIANTNLTSGTKEVLREGEAVRMVWRIDRLEAGKSHRLILDVIPRKAQVFDLNVEWSLAPVGGAVQVQVTEPMLKMGITGPDEVQYGQTVLYNVAIRNPGTGVAENVNIMLSEALGGERANLGNIGPGEEKNLQVELIARSAGLLELSATVNGDGNLKDNASRQITVRRAQLKIGVEAPPAKFAGTTGNVQITIENIGDAIAQDVLAAIGLPAGLEYLSGIDAAERMDSGLRWNVGSMTPGAKRTYRVACLFNTSGDVQIDAGVRGAGDLADAAVARTMVETLADLVLTVEDPRGPLPVGEDVTYQIRIANRGTKAATNLELVMHFSNGIEPTLAEGNGHKLNPGEVLFDTIRQLDPNEELVFKVAAKAAMPGAHAYRAQLTCVEADSREMAGGTTKFFGDEAQTVPVSQPPAVEPAAELSEQPELPSSVITK